MYPGIETRVEDVVDRLARARPPPLGERERQQAEQRRSSGERLADGARESELLAARQHEEAVSPRLVGQHLEIGQEFRDALDLVQDGALAQPGQKAPGVGFGEFPLVRRFQVDVLEVRKSRAAKRGFAGLPRAGQRDERVLFEQRFEAGCDLALDHGDRVARFRHNCKYCFQYCNMAHAPVLPARRPS